MEDRQNDLNVLYDPWIPVRMLNGNTEMKSVLEVLEQADQIAALEFPVLMQNIIATRFLEAILLCSFYQYDEQGQEVRLEDDVDAYIRWNELFKAGKFDIQIIEQYLEPYRDRFWLLDDKYPFMQSFTAKRSKTACTAAKMHVDLLENNNKKRQCQPRRGENKTTISLPEAAIQLLWLQNCDDTSIKPSAELKQLTKEHLADPASPGAGWLGRIAPVLLRGDNLFKTLMLNLVLVDDSGSLWERLTPAWAEPPHDEEKGYIPPPDNPAQLYTVQTRRLLLEHEGGTVTGVRIVGGDAILKDELESGGGYFVEPNCLYKCIPATKNKPKQYLIRRHNPSHFIWQDISSILTSAKEPGVVRWMKRLQDKEYIPDDMVVYIDMAAVTYCDKDTSVTGIFGDSIMTRCNVLYDKNRCYTSAADAALMLCDTIAKNAGYMARCIFLAEGTDNKKKLDSEQDKASALVYSLFDPEVRKLLGALDSKKENLQTEMARFCKATSRIIMQIQEIYIDQASSTAFAGRWIKENKKNRHCSLPEATDRFSRLAYGELSQLKRVYSGEDERKDDRF